MPKPLRLALGLTLASALAPAALGQCPGPNCPRPRALVHPVLIRPQAPGYPDSPAGALAQLNDARARAGLRPLAWDATLAAFASRNCGIHQPGTSGGAGQCWAGVGSYTRAMGLWLSSPGHAAILLGARSSIGISPCPSGMTANAR